MNTRAVIFDMDGVVIDSEPAWIAADAAFLEPYGGTMTAEILAEITGQTLILGSAYLKQRFQIPLPVEEISRQRIKGVHDRYKTELILMPGYSELMEDLLASSVRRGLASGASPITIKYVVERFGLQGHFEHLVSCEEVPRAKPHPDVFLETADRLNVSPRDCIVIEDSPNGVLAAKAAGMRCLATPNPRLAGHAAFASADLRRPALRDITLADLGL
jgi:HAD superfamily hydrolase (TIGR01509 family)